ncbi:high-affinity branched-chain amino acid ABC transporter permease LivM [Endozoicomonas elysicola]|uniref:Leucine/isoleucine/valine transporter permease subunit n=1 Tax=Endozoicomonas elysicola TaxID=305900 RepID=A0A081K8I8_9GAMM|nr:high-affinity branched-chain amino acid ABC transporter permease LivM [Endozoicomonas elysicola]KEI70464.1 leucine/isoleucine/valine transporter permease subunit [Endozoicomonas elysicola]
MNNNRFSSGFRWFPAFMAAGALLLLAVLMMGVQLSTENTELVVHFAASERWNLILAGAVLVFLVQLFRDSITSLWHGLKKHNPLPKVSLPSLEDHKPLKRMLACFMVAGLMIWPFFVSRGAVDLATLALIYVMLGLGLNVVVGLAGLLDLGYVGFYAVGAYSYALLNQYFGLDFWSCLLIGGIMAAFFGFILGFPVLRLRGDYLAIVTLGFGEIIRILLNNWTSITGGPNGISQIPKPTLFGLEFTRRAKEEGNIPFHEFFGIDYSSGYKVIFLYILALLLVLVTLYIINRLLRMPIGRAWEALREDDIACRSLGLNPTAIKLSAFTIGAAFAGFAGTFFAARQGFISPESFTFIESAIILAIVVLGGMGSQMGVILAAIIMTVLPEFAREFQEYRMLMFGLMMVLMMIWRPEGLMPMKRPHLTLRDRQADQDDVTMKTQPAAESV